MAMPSSSPGRKLNLPLMGVALAVSSALMGMALLMHLVGGIPIGQLTRDPSSITGSPSYTGLISQLGLFFWAATAAVCCFSAVLASERPRGRSTARFLLASGLLTLLLGLDDAFLLHEDVFPGLGIPEKAVFVIYGTLTALYLVVFRRAILSTRYELLLMAFVFLGSSVLLDLLDQPFFVEDGAKLAGIVSWLSYFCCAGAAALRRQAAQAETAAARTVSTSLPALRVVQGGTPSTWTATDEYDPDAAPCTEQDDAARPSRSAAAGGAR